MTAAEKDPILVAVDALIPAFAESRLEELEVEAEGVTIRIARPRAEIDLAAFASAASAGQGSGAGADAAQARPAPGTDAPRPSPSDGMPFGAPTAGMHFVNAPLTGVWYSAPAPGARPYLENGGEVASGQVIGLIEAMKLFNEIKSDASGKVNRILAEDGKLVKRQQPILEIDPR